VFLFAAVVPSFLSLLVALVAPQAVYPVFATVVLLPYTACFVATLQISDYVSYRDVFHAEETLAPA